MERCCGTCKQSWRNESAVLSRLGCHAKASSLPFWAIRPSSYHPNSPFAFLLAHDGTDCKAWEPRSAPESPAKEQPGEQNVSDIRFENNRTTEIANPAASAPDVAAMVKRLGRLAGHDAIRGTQIDGASVSQSLNDAAALIEKLGQNYPPVGYTIAGWLRGDHFLGLPEHVRPGDQPLYIRTPPPPERP